MLEYVCDICDRSFDSEIGFKVHRTACMKNQKPFICECGKSYKYKQGLKEHQERKHPTLPAKTETVKVNVETAIQGLHKHDDINYCPHCGFHLLPVFMALMLTNNLQTQQAVKN